MTLLTQQIIFFSVVLTLFIVGMTVTETFTCDIEFSVTDTTTAHTCALLGYPHN